MIIFPPLRRYHKLIVGDTFGTVLNEGAAGSLYYKLPMILVAQVTGNTTQIFVGCYTLHLTQSGVQVQPPFHSMGILGGKFTQGANNADTHAMLPTPYNGLNLPPKVVGTGTNYAKPLLIGTNYLMALSPPPCFRWRPRRRGRQRDQF